MKCWQENANTKLFFNEALRFRGADKVPSAIRHPPFNPVQRHHGGWRLAPYPPYA